MQEWSGTAVRDLWIKFFETKEHHLVAPVNLIPVNDPSLLWINSGVATLKDYFTGKKTPPATKIVNIQKSIRTNDIENVGYTSRHHTSFEMLGNFALGSYFKAEAIAMAWEFLTSATWLNLDPARLYVTIFKEDQTAYNIWTNEIKLPITHLIMGDRTTNFWDVGQGPCGPNTEIFYDRGPKFDLHQQGLALLENDIENERYIEIWNIVFSEYENDGHNNYKPLPRKNIDTGAGLERITAILQDVPTNFDTDLFLPIIRKCETLTEDKYEINNYFIQASHQTKVNIAFKIIADHLRTLVFAIGDGAMPSNKDRGYVLRRLVRRSVVYGQKLGIQKPFLAELVPTTVTLLASFYPELISKTTVIMEIITEEEIKFWKTLEHGQKLLLQEIKQTETKILSAATVFQLFDTFGFPLELTQEIAAEHGFTVDVKQFEADLKHHKAVARAARKLQHGMDVSRAIIAVPKTIFVGYEQETLPNAIVLALLQAGEEVASFTGEGQVILDRTPFYAEKGGQAADDGVFKIHNAEIAVLDVQEENQHYLHTVKTTTSLMKNDVLTAEINHDHRQYRMKNHSATHFLHAALRKVLGNHVMQAGSFNNNEYLRIDFAHNKILQPAEIDMIEALVNDFIASKTPCEVLYTDFATAQHMGALAFFGERYDAKVRVVKFGTFSIELCGGTHCHNSAEVEAFLITNVVNKGSGNYRIHAVSGRKFVQNTVDEAFHNVANTVQKWQTTIQATKTDIDAGEVINFLNTFEIQPRTTTFYRDLTKWLQQAEILYKKWQRKVQQAEKVMAHKQFETLVSHKIHNIEVLVYYFNNIEQDSVQATMQQWQQKLKNNYIICFFNKISPTHININIAIAKDLQPKYQARDFLKWFIAQFKGTGGGAAAFAQGKLTQLPENAAVQAFWNEVLQ